jgi:hypothetical protein
MNTFSEMVDQWLRDQPVAVEETCGPGGKECYDLPRNELTFSASKFSNDAAVPEVSHVPSENRQVGAVP